MKLPLLVREIYPSERAMVLSDWKKELEDEKVVADSELAKSRASAPVARRWQHGLRWPEFWALVNYVVDRITFPSCQVWAGCHRETPDTALCWMAVRDGKILQRCARRSVVERDPALAAAIEREMLAHLRSVPDEFNPFLELKRP